MNRRDFIKAVGLTAASFSLSGCSSLMGGRSDSRPNIVFIIADDLGYGEVGCYGQKKIRTPRLDEMAARGVRFTNHYAGYTTCTASRRSLMLGKHHGHNFHGPTLREEDTTIAMLLQDAGYRTAMIGKWGMIGRPGHVGSPGNKGFDHSFTYDNQGFAHFYYPEFLWRNDEKVLYPDNHDLIDENGEYKKGLGTYSHDEFAKEALGFIKENKDRPFFLYLPFTVPHAELTVPEDSMEEYRKLNWPEVPKIQGGGGSKNPGYGSQYTKGYCGQSEPNAAYAGMITRMDRSVGQVIDLLDELNLSDNTLVIFTSDNGPSAEGGQSMEFFNSSGALTGGKRSIYEGGTRVPFIAMWPGKIKAGTETDHISAFCDFMPTACEVVGIEPVAEIDGISYLPELKGNSDQQDKDRYIYNKWKNADSVRVSNYKLIRFREGKKYRYELYDLDKDVSEKNNLADKMPEKVKELNEIFVEATRKKKK